MNDSFSDLSGCLRCGGQLVQTKTLQNQWFAHRWRDCFDAAIARAEKAELQADRLRTRAIDGFTRIRNASEGDSNYIYDLANSAIRTINDVATTPTLATEEKTI